MTDQQLEIYRKIIGKIIYTRYRWFIQKYPDLKEDMVQTGLYTVLCCERTFIPDKGVKFETYIYRPIINALLIFVCDWLGYEGSKGKRRPRWDNESIEGMFDEMVGYDMKGGSNDTTRNKYLMDEDKNYNRVDMWEVFHQYTTPKEYQILVLMSQGYNQREIADMWGFHHHTVNNYFLNAKRKIKRALM